MSITLRTDQSTPLTWQQLDDNFRGVMDIQTQIGSQVQIAQDAASSAAQSSTSSQDSAELAEEMARISVVRWCGNHTEAPTTRLDGSPLEISDEYGNLTDNLRYNWTGSVWVALNSSAQELEERLSNPVSADDGSSILGRGVVSIATISELMALPDQARRSDLRYLVAEYASGTGVGGGEFRWASANLSTSVASDPMRGLFAPPTTDPTGASGAFFRVYSGEMFADWFGVVYGQAVDVTSGLQAASNLVRAGRGLRVRGDVLVSTTWDISALPPRWEIVVDGTIYAAPGVFTALRMGGIYCRFKAVAMEKLGGIRQGGSYEMLSMFFGDVDILSIDKFGDGPSHIGVHSRPNGVNGIAWCHIKIKNINVLNVAALFTTRTDTPGMTNGYINENIIQIGYMGGSKGIYFKKGPDQTNRFDGNLFIKPGFEQITGAAALDLESCTRFTVSDWRFEASGIANLQIREDANCSRNVYRGSWSLLVSKLSFMGSLVNIDAEIIDADGGLIALGAKQLVGSALTYNSGEAWSIRSPSDSIELRVKSPSLGFPERLDVKGPTSINGFLEVKTRNSYQSIPAGTTTADVIPGTQHVSVSLASSSLSLNMPLALELNGRDIKLTVTSIVGGNTISIKKSTGTTTAGAGITTTGLYSLAYFADAWKISKIGEVYSS